MATEKSSKRKQILPIILIVILIVGLGFGLNEFIFSLHHETTDDAQIDGDISPVNARVSGYIEEIRFKENQLVRINDTLVIIDDRDLKIKVAQAEAALNVAVANADVAKANVTSVEANVQTAKSNVDQAKVKLWKANQDYARYENLLSDKTITQAQFDGAKADKESAESGLEAAMKQLEAVKTQVTAAQQQAVAASSQIKTKEADLDLAKLQLSYTVVTSPANGIASKKNIQIGQLVQAGQPMLAVVTDSNSYVVANFKETQLDKMKEGQEVDIKIDAFPSEKIKGSIYSFAGATGARFSLLPPDNATGNFVKVIQRVPVKIAMTIPKEIALRLRPGMSVRVTVRID